MESLTYNDIKVVSEYDGTAYSIAGVLGDDIELAVGKLTFKWRGPSPELQLRMHERRIERTLWERYQKRVKHDKEEKLYADVEKLKKKAGLK